MPNKPVNSLLQVTQTYHGLLPILTIPLVTKNPCLNFVNTIDWRLLPEKHNDMLTSYSSLLAFTLRLNLISIEDYNRLRDKAENATSAAERSYNDARSFRDALTTIIDSLVALRIGLPQNENSREALAIFEAARRRSHESESVIWERDSLTLISHPEDEGLDMPWLMLVRDAELLLCSAEASHIHICSAEGCGWVFLDESKNRTRRWCSMLLCGNREKAARYRAKER
jgi:predicted RNA-binding Zn ribbon-like protein